MSEVGFYNENAVSPFDAIKQVRPDGSEFWSARTLQGLMGYTKWQNLATVIARAMQAASNTGMDVTSHFTETSQVVARAQGGGSTRDDFELSRRGAYLMAMNADPAKPEVAAAQAYFASRTVQAETAENRLAGMPEWVRQQMATLMQVGKIEVEQQRQAEQLRQVSARVEAIEGAHDWFSALGYAKLHDLPTEQRYLQRVGMRAGRALRDDGGVPGKTTHPAFGTVNTYPTWALERAFAQVPTGGAA